MTIAIAFVLIPIILLIGFGIPLAIGLYVYRDARRRGMNAVLWTLVAILAPSLIGFIIYLLVRNSSSDMLCPRCDTPVKEDYVICPNCGAKLQPYCSNCATPLQPEWKVCPKCTQPIANAYDDIVAPQRHKDTSLGKILVAVLVIPVLLIVVLVLSASVFKVSTSGGGSSSVMTEASWNELTRSLQGNNATEVSQWLEDAHEEGDNEKAYILEYMQPTIYGSWEYYYTIYVPAVDSGAEMGFGMRGGFFKDVIAFELDDGYIEDENSNADDDTTSKNVYCIEVDMETERAIKVEVSYNGKKLKCEVTTVEYNPTGNLFDVILE